MLPEQQVAAILYILLNTWCSILSYVREVPDIIVIASLEVAQPEEHTVVLNVLNGTDVAEIDVLTLRIVLFEPQPCAGLIVITIGKKLLWCGIFRQEAGNLTTDLCRSINRQSLTIFVLCDKSSIPALLQHNILKKIGSAVDCRLDLSAAITVHKLQDV